jgi:peptide-methionine (R)-S-oxide reductase
MREQGTERSFSDGNFHDNKKDGVYKCKGCDVILFESEAKYNSGTGCILLN